MDVVEDMKIICMMAADNSMAIMKDVYAIGATRSVKRNAYAIIAA